MIRVHTQPLICFQFADSDVVYFLVQVQLEIKLAPFNCVVQSLPSVIRSSEQCFGLTLKPQCAVKEDQELSSDNFPIPC